jgi:hypothetical protein
MRSGLWKDFVVSRHLITPHIGDAMPNRWSSSVGIRSGSRRTIAVPDGIYGHENIRS